MERFSNSSVVTTMILSGSFSGVLFDWHAYGFAFTPGVLALSCFGLMIMRYLDGTLQ
jgi:hypothetical protein